MGFVLRFVTAAIVAGALGCDPGSPDPDAAVPSDAAAGGTVDAGTSDAAVGTDAAPAVDGGGTGDAGAPPDASQEEDGGGVVPVECEQADDFAIPVDPAGVVAGAGATVRPGGFVVVWAVEDGIDTFVRARLLDDCGVPEGDEIDVDASGQAVGAPVAAAIGGTDDFVLAWSREDGDGDGAGVVFRRFGADGSPLGLEALANEMTFDDQIVTSATSLSAGFGLVWEDHSGAALVRPDAVLSTFDETGDPMTGEILVSEGADGPQNLPLVASAADGTILAVWSQEGMAFGRRRNEFGWVDADGFALGDGAALAGSVAASDDAFAVALKSSAEDIEGDIVLALVDGAEGAASPATIAARPGTERDPVVARLAEGLLVAWTDETYRDDPEAVDSSGTTVMAVFTDDRGLVDGEPFVVPTTTDFDQELRAGAGGAAGVLLVWLDKSRADDDENGGLRGRLITSGEGP